MKTKTWKEVEELITEKTVAILPVGSIEQHGLHAPLGTDFFIAEFLAETVNENENALLIPTIPVGIADYHRHFAGSLWVKPETFKNYISEIVESLSFHGIKKVIIINGHGGNRGSLNEIARNLNSKKKLNVITWTWFESIEENIINLFGDSPSLHASEVETSLLLNITPQFIKINNYKSSAKGASKEWGEFYEGTLISQDVKNFSQSGATGDPSKTNLKLGKEMLKLSKEKLNNLINHVSSL